MYTYQDLLAVGENEKDRALFCSDAIKQFMASDEYRAAVAGEAYYAKRNLTIEKFQKFLYTLSGKKVEDIFSSNYKLKTSYFRRLVQQQVQYVLGNGLVLQNPSNKKKLGKKFDQNLVKAAKTAMAAGRAFGFWNLDHLEVFGFADTKREPGFCPLYSEEDASLMAGIRFWFKVVGNKKILRCTLYEVDGLTEYRITDGTDVAVLVDKKPYKQTVISTEADGVQNVIGENYSALPIVTLYANDTEESELVGIRESIDCYDFIKSGFANDIDDTSGFYWILKNTGGMEDVDLAKFIQRMKTVRAAVIEGDEGADAEARTLDIPTEARRVMLEILRNDIYEDFQSLDVRTLSASAKTTQEIQAAYQNMDNKCADFEFYVIEFVQEILALAGIDDNPTFIWNRVINMKEQTEMVLSAANYLTEEAVIKHLPFLTPEEADEIIKKRDTDSYNRFGAGDDDTDDDVDKDKDSDSDIDNDNGASGE